jgi:transposase-like protein
VKSEAFDSEMFFRGGADAEDLLAERGIDVSYETVRFLWNRFGPMFAAEMG